MQEGHHLRCRAGAERGAARVAEADLEVGSAGDADDPRADLADRLAGAYMGADRELVGRPGVSVVDVAVTPNRAVAVKHRSPGAKATDSVQDDRAAADG